jgi:hypothetical protein
MMKVSAAPEYWVQRLPNFSHIESRKGLIEPRPGQASSPAFVFFPGNDRVSKDLRCRRSGIPDQKPGHITRLTGAQGGLRQSTGAALGLPNPPGVI